MEKERVDYSQIKDEVSNLTDLANNIDSASDSIKSSIDSIKSAWEGSAAEAYVGEIEKLANNLPDAVRQLAEATYFLASCSDNFQEIEDSLGKQLRELIGEDYINSYDASKGQNTDLGSRLTIDDIVKTRNIQSATPESETPESETPESETPSNDIPYVPITPTLTGTIFQASSQTNGKTNNESEKENKISPLKKGESMKIPENIKQGDYTTSLYEKDNKFKENSPEEKLQKMWKSQENNEKDNLATIKVNNEDRYLVAVSPKCGNVGDNIDVNLKDGTVVKCVIARNLEIKETSTNIYGIEDANGKTSIIDFQIVNKNAEVKYAWDKNSPITEITNKGNSLNLDTTIKAETTQMTSAQTEANTQKATTENTTSIDNTETKKA